MDQPLPVADDDTRRRDNIHIFLETMSYIDYDSIELPKSNDCFNAMNLRCIVTVVVYVVINYCCLSTDQRKKYEWTRDVYYKQEGYHMTDSGSEAI